MEFAPFKIGTQPKKQTAKGEKQTYKKSHFNNFNQLLLSILKYYF